MNTKIMLLCVTVLILKNINYSKDETAYNFSLLVLHKL